MIRKSGFRTLTSLVLIAAFVFMVIPSFTASADLTEGFDDITLLAGTGWAMQNNSNPLGVTGWFQGNDVVFPSQSGAATSYIAANYNNTSGVGTISNWLISPVFSINTNDTITFYARAADGGWADRLQVRMSLNGASTDVGATATSVGDFTELLLDINPTYQGGVFPNTWTLHTITITGVNTPTDGRIAFRYFVENGGPSGANSDFIGIDTFDYVDVAPPAPPAGDDDDDAAEVYVPSAADHARAQAPLCADMDGSTDEAVRANMSGGEVPGGGVYCRMLDDNMGMMVGNADLMEMHPMHAVDVFGMAGTTSHTSFNSSVEICLAGTGQLAFLDASAMPRTLSWLPTTYYGGYSCARIYGAGTVVLVP